MRCIVAISEAGSLTRAAEHLGLAQPALTQTLNRLEQEIGAKLFTRNRRGAALTEAGATVEGVVITDPPVDALAAAVLSHDAQEAIILTRPHVVAEFFHVDWTSKARRKIGVPVLHLLEHENFDEQAEGYGEGITGL